MRIVGEWRSCDDGVTRPVIIAKVQGADGAYHSGRFLIDSGADRTVFSAYFLDDLGFPTTPSTQDFALEGIGGASDSVVMRTVVELTDDGGGPARIRGEFAAFTDPAATDLCILGRDVLNNFDLILSYPRKEVLLLAKAHSYRIGIA